MGVSTVSTNIRIPADLIERYESLSRPYGTRNAFLIEAFSAYMDEYEEGMESSAEEQQTVLAWIEGMKEKLDRQIRSALLGCPWSDAAHWAGDDEDMTDHDYEMASMFARSFRVWSRIHAMYFSGSYYDRHPLSITDYYTAREDLETQSADIAMKELNRIMKELDFYKARDLVRKVDSVIRDA